MGYAAVSVGATATLLVDANPQRLSLIIINKGGDPVHYGQDANVTSSNSPYLLPDTSLTEDSGGTKVYCGPFYGCTTGGTATVYYWERTR